MGDGIRTDRAWSLPKADLLAGRRALWWTAGPDGELAVMLVHRRRLRRSGTKGWVGSRPRPPFDALLVTVTDQGERRVALPALQNAPTHLALLPDRRLLLVVSRSFKEATTGSWQRNATVLDPSGKLLDTFCIGDDITALTTDPGGRIWTVYGDEGIYGDNPVSWKGMAGWDSAGRAVWSPEGRLPALPLGGWTAATEGEDVWLAWYPGGSPGTVLTRITPSTGETANLLSPVRNPDGLAVRGNRAVLTVRDHNRRSVEVVRAELEGTDWTVTDRRRLRTPGRVVLHCGQGRDGVLWLRAGHTWLRIRA